MKPPIALVAAIALMTFPAMAKPTTGSISPAHDTGQPGVECEDGGTAPGTQSGRDPGPGSPFQEDSISGAHYAGELTGVNDKNTASVSQYDLACFKGPQ